MTQSGPHCAPRTALCPAHRKPCHPVPIRFHLPPCCHPATQSVIIFTVLLGAFTSGLVGWLLKPTDMTPGNTMPTLPSMDPDTLK